MRRASLALVLAGASAGACGREPVQPLASPARPVTVDAPAEVRLVPSGGPVPHHALVRVVNAWGAPEAAGPVTVRRDGEPRLVELDRFGYGRVNVDEVGAVELADEDGAAVLVHGFQAGFAGFDLHRYWPVGVAQADRVVAAADGYLVAEGGRVWWAGPGGPAHEVLAVEDDLRGLRAGDQDLDGTVDAVGWTASTVILLRGRPTGGASFAGAWRADGYAPAGAVLHDVTGDRRPDLVVAWAADNDGLLDVLAGDGEGGFAPLATAELRTVPADVVVSDPSGDDRLQLTVLHDRARGWSRFAWAAPRLVEVGPTAPEALGGADGLEGARLHPAGDVNADSGDELVVVSDSPPGLRLFDLRTDAQACASEVEGAQCEVAALEIDVPAGVSVTLGDGDGDKVDDVWVVDEDGALVLRHWVGAQQALVEIDPELDLPGQGPLALADLDGDGVVELAQASHGLWTWWGRAWPNQTERVWTPRGLNDQRVRSRVVGPYALLEADGDAQTVEVLVVTHEDGDTRVKLVRYDPAEGRAPVLAGLALLDDKIVPDDLAVCEDQAYLALDGQVWWLELEDEGGVRLRATFGRGARRVDCTTTALAWLEPEEVAFAVIAEGSATRVPAKGAQDVVVALNDGVPEAVPCVAAEGAETARCEVVRWDDDSGSPPLVYSDDTGTRLGDGTVVHPWPASLAVADVDGDGDRDLLSVVGAHRVVVSRTSGPGLAPAPPEVWHTVEPLQGGLGARDGDGDGSPDLWRLEADGDLRFTQPAGGG